MRVESLQVQLSTAMHRLSVLQRRAEQLSPEPPKLVQLALKELALALEQLRLANDELIVQREQVAAAREQAEVARRKYWELFDGAPDAYLVTGSDTDILEANRAAAELLNISQRFLVGKSLSVFVVTDRNRILAQARRLAETGGSADWVFRVRPRERAPFDVACRVIASDPGERTLRWLVRRIDSGSPTPALSTTDFSDDARTK